MKKISLLIAKILAFLVAVVIFAVLGFKAFDGIKHASFYKNAEPVFKMPGVNDNFTHQGFTYVEDDKVFLATGYMSNNTASRVYVIKENGETTYTELKKASGEDYKEHTGGITHKGDYVFITGTNGLDIFPYQDILQGKESATQLGEIKT